MIRSLAPVGSILALLLLARPEAAAAADRIWHDLPVITRISSDAQGIRIHTSPDSASQIWTARFDQGADEWSAFEARAETASTASSRLDQVLVFQGGLFDQFAGRTTIDLGAGFTLAKRDSGYMLLENGEERGWPAVTEDEAERWSREVRLGLPRDFPEDRVMQLLATGRLQNVPGPVVVTDEALWFGLAGGFSGGDGQLGGVVGYDRAKRTFSVFRHKFMVDASVTRLLVSGDDVWIGTGRFGPTRLEGMRGLVLLRPKKREWRQFSPGNSRISGDLVYELAQDGSSLWATTNRGVSRYDTKRRLWSSWYWHPVGEWTGFELKERPPGDLAEELVR